MQRLKKRVMLSYLFIFIHYFVFSLHAYTEGALCQQALRQAARKNFSASYKILQQKKCPLTSELVTWLMLKSGSNEASFQNYCNFIKDHEHWPWLDILKHKAESHIRDDDSPSNILTWFKANPPRTITGLGHYLSALKQKKRVHEITLEIRRFWMEKNLTLSEEQVFLKKFKTYLRSSDIRDKAVQRLNKYQTEEAMNLSKHVTNLDQKYIEARILLQKKSNLAETYIKKFNLMPSKDIYFAKDYLTWLRKTESSNHSVFFQKISSLMRTHAKDFWKERYITAHESLEAGDVFKSYKLASNHGLSQGVDFVEAEWFCGWIALRFMKNPQKALRHFSKLQSIVKTPISRARIFYWMGRAYEDLSAIKKSKEFYQKSSHFKTTFYGQQSYEKLGFSAQDIKLEPLHFTSAQNKKFIQYSFVKIIYLLAQADLDQHVLSFSYILAKKLPSSIERQQLLALVYNLAPNYAVTIAQTISFHQSVAHPEAYPTLKNYYNQHDQDVDMALVHAVIRKESSFVPQAISSANAQGFMQLLPETAKPLAHELKISWSKNLLTEQPLLNVKLGTLYLKKQLKKYNNSLPKTLASYNAGSGTLAKWLVRFSDPDDLEIDILDWIEILPYSETRNYIHRVLENFVIYTSIL